VLFYAVFARALLSWFDQGGYNDISRLLYSLTEPMLRIFRAMLPNLGGLDLSIILALMGLQLAEMLLLPPLYQLASLIG
jgi:YggT family protein